MCLVEKQIGDCSSTVIMSFNNRKYHFLFQNSTYFEQRKSFKLELEYFTVLNRVFVFKHESKGG